MLNKSFSTKQIYPTIVLHIGATSFSLVTLTSPTCLKTDYKVKVVQIQNKSLPYRLCLALDLDECWSIWCYRPAGRKALFREEVILWHKNVMWYCIPAIIAVIISACLNQQRIKCAACINCLRYSVPIIRGETISANDSLCCTNQSRVDSLCPIFQFGPWNGTAVCSRFSKRWLKSK